MKSENDRNSTRRSHWTPNTQVLVASNWPSRVSLSSPVRSLAKVISRSSEAPMRLKTRSSLAMPSPNRTMSLCAIRMLPLTSWIVS